MLNKSNNAVPNLDKGDPYNGDDDGSDDGDDDDGSDNGDEANNDDVEEKNVRYASSWKRKYLSDDILVLNDKLSWSQR